MYTVLFVVDASLDVAAPAIDACDDPVVDDDDHDALLREMHIETFAMKIGAFSLVAPPTLDPEYTLDVVADATLHCEM